MRAQYSGVHGGRCRRVRGRVTGKTRSSAVGSENEKRKRGTRLSGRNDENGDPKILQILFRPAFCRTTVTTAAVAVAATAIIVNDFHSFSGSGGVSHCRRGLVFLLFFFSTPFARSRHRFDAFLRNVPGRDFYPARAARQPRNESSLRRRARGGRPSSSVYNPAVIMCRTAGFRRKNAAVFRGLVARARPPRHDCRVFSNRPSNRLFT